MQKTIFGIGHQGFESKDLSQAIKKQFSLKEQDSIDNFMYLGNFIEELPLNKSCSNTTEKEEKHIKKIGDTLFKKITTTTITSNSHKILQKEKGKN